MLKTGLNRPPPCNHTRNRAPIPPSPFGTAKAGAERSLREKKTVIISQMHDVDEAVRGFAVVKAGPIRQLGK